MQELELRGRLTKAEYDAAKVLLDKKATATPNNKLSQFFQFDRGILKVSHHADSGKTVLSLKLGDEALNNLQELEVELKHDAFDNTVRLIEKLGYTKREIVDQRRIDYMFNGITISLKHTADWGYHFEAEKLFEDPQDEAAARLKLQEICQELGLRPMTSEELSAFLEKLTPQR